jgi:hypothetical protein
MPAAARRHSLPRSEPGAFFVRLGLNVHGFLLSVRTAAGVAHVLTASMRDGRCVLTEARPPIQHISLVALVAHHRRVALPNGALLVRPLPPPASITLPR